MKKYLIIAACLFFLPGKITAQSDTIRLALSSDLLLPVQEICRAFTEKHQTPFTISSASVGVLSEQIRQKTAFDLLLSSDRRFHKILNEEGFISLKTKDFAFSPLVLWTKIKDTGKSPSALLADERIQKIYAPADKLSFFGLCVYDYLKKSKFPETVMKKLIDVESIAKVNSMIFVEEADAAFASVSAMHSNTLKDKGLWTIISDKKYSVPLTASISRSGGRNGTEAARNFFEFLDGPEARKILKTHGYLTD